MRMRNKPKAAEEIRKREAFLVDTQGPLPVDLGRVFGNENPVYLELGAGKGQFITRTAELHPDRNFIGVEVKKEVVASAVRRIETLGLQNCRFIWDNIRFIGSWFPRGSIAGVYLNFSDPWPKVRHQKRRLTHPEFLEQYCSLLRPGGFIQFRTDNQDLFEYSLNVLLEQGFIVRDVRLDWHRCPDSEGMPRTEYEEKFSQAGKRIMQLTAWPQAEKSGKE